MCWEDIREILDKNGLALQYMTQPDANIGSSKGENNTMSDSAIVAIGAAIPGLPFVAVAITGLVLSILRRSRFPRGARWASVGFTCLLLHFLVDLYSVAFSAFEGPPLNSVNSLIWMTALTYVLRLLGLVALAIAVFAERAPARQIAPGGL